MGVAAFENCSGLLVAVFSLVLISSVYAQCTPSTCPDGPVIVQFEYANCTGNYEFYSFLHDTPCSGGSMTIVTETEVTVYNSITNAECDLTLANVSYSGSGFRFGVCGGNPLQKRDAKDEFPEDMNPASILASYIRPSHSKTRTNGEAMLYASSSPYSGMMVLANVNVSFSASSPQPYFQYNPSIEDVAIIDDSEPCYSVDNCTRPQGGQAQYWTTSYSDSNCQDPTSSDMFPLLQLNSGCYNEYNGTYLSYHCVDEHTIFVAFSFGDSCATPPNSFAFRRAVCSSESTQSVHCIAPPSSNPTPPPSSAQSLNLTYASLLALVATIAALIAIF